MANLPISGLFPGTAVSATDLFPDVQTPGVGPVKVTAAQIKYYTNLTPTIINPIVLNTITIGATGSSQGSIILHNTNVGNYPVTVKSSNSGTAAWTLTLPVDAGTSGYSLLTDGNGTTSWAIPVTRNITGGAASQLLYQTSGTTTGFVPNGTTAQVLLSNGSAAPSWGALDLSSSLACTNVLPVVRGGTGMSTVGTAGQALVSDGVNIVYGDPLKAYNVIGGLANEVLYQSGTDTTTFVTPGLTNQSLIVSATGAPAWNAVDLSSVNAIKNTLPISNGGTGLTSVGAVGQSLVSDGTALVYGNPYSARADNLAGGFASQIPYQSAANTTAFLPNGTPGQVLTSNGTIAPSWKSPPATSFNVGIPSSGTITSILTAYGINDAVGNYYTFVNNNASAVTITAATIDNYNAYPFNATTNSIVVQPNSSVSLATVAIGSEYIITNASPFTPSVNLNLTGTTTLTAATSVDRYAVFNMSVITTGSTITVPSPTKTTAGRIITIINSGISFFYIQASAYKIGLGINQTITLTWNGSFWYFSNAPKASFQVGYGGPSSISMGTLVNTYFNTTDLVNNSYTISNNTTGAVTVSAISFANPGQFNFYATSTTLVIPYQGQATLRTVTPGSTYYIESMSTNQSSGTAPYFYGYLFNDTTYTTGPADRAVMWQTASSSPTINYSGGTFTFPIAGLYHFDFGAVIATTGGGSGDQINIQLQTSSVTPQPISQQLGLGNGNYTMNLSQTIYIPANGTVAATWYANGSSVTLKKNVTQISVARISG